MTPSYEIGLIEFMLLQFLWLWIYLVSIRDINQNRAIIILSLFEQLKPFDIPYPSLIRPQSRPLEFPTSLYAPLLTVLQQTI